MEIRILGEDDAEAYWRLRREALETEPAAFGMAAEEFVRTSPEETRKRLRELPSDSFYMGGFDQQELVAIATFIRSTYVKEAHKGHIYGVYVRASHRDRGLGGAMLEAVLTKARKQPGLEQVLLAVATCREPALRLYRKLGFEAYGTEPRALKVGTEYIDEQLMILRLG